MNHKDKKSAHIVKYIICKQISTVYSLSSQSILNNLKNNIKLVK